MKRTFLLFYVFFSSIVISAQVGAPLLSHYTESREIEDQSWAICQDDANVMLFAYRKGILSFDGKDWLVTRIPTIPYSMQKNPEDGRIYIGGENDFGYLEKEKLNSYRFISLSDNSSGLGVITNILFSDSLVWFYGEKSVSRYNVMHDMIEMRLDSKPGFPFTGMLLVAGDAFINVMDKGLHRVESDTLFPIVTGYLTEKTEILFSLPYDRNRVLVGINDGSLALFDGVKYYDYPVKDEGYLRENILSEGITVGDSAYAFSTLEGGALVINRVNGGVLYNINNQNELPDDEVFAIGMDNSGGLWLSHQYGLTRADLNLPVKNFTIFPGLKGNLTSSLQSGGELYVATSEGVFYLSEVKNYSEVEILIRNRPAATQSSQGSPSADAREPRKSRRNIFNRIFGRRTIQETNEPVAMQQKREPAALYTRRTISRLKSINYIFKKVTGLNEKCRQLVSTENGILAATNKGLFVINDHKATIATENRYINSICWKPGDGKYYVGANDGYIAVKCTEGKWITEIMDPGYSNPVYSIIQADTDTLWLGGDNAIYRAISDPDRVMMKYTTYTISTEFPQRYVLNFINDTVFLFTESGIHYYEDRSNGFVPYRTVSVSSQDARDFIYPLSNRPLIMHNEEWSDLEQAGTVTGKELALLKIFDNIVSVSVEDDHIWIIDGYNRLFDISRRKYSKISPVNDVFFKSISNEKGTRFNLTDIEFERGDDLIRFDIIAPGYLKQGSTRYQYYINKLMTDWSPWSLETSYAVSIRKPGDYVLQVRAKDLWGNIGEPESVTFSMKAKFTQTASFWILSGLILTALVILIILFRERQLRIKNRILEDRIHERTARIEAQKYEITSSIEYASRIQMAMLPMEDHFREVFSDYFIIFKPRDIVSGDFYWIGEDDKFIFFTVADCTGHGVPGAFMSTMGISTLNEIVANNRNLQANIVLNLLREKTKLSLHQTGKAGEANDGMDVAFCVLNKNRKTLQYAGAFNPLFIFQSGEFVEYRPDRMPIGIHYGDEKSFTNYVINVSRGDTVYIFSDGFTSQFGGPAGTKYKKSK
ncbi:MAG: SpoIIE family protein phosphatase, partial [Bacteroidales bacterium]|nr:SpoIIE family protein phosphatase [Bacteroidales bacterium]